jgi:hypothetical protein
LISTDVKKKNQTTTTRRGARRRRRREASGARAERASERKETAFSCFVVCLQLGFVVVLMRVGKSQKKRKKIDNDCLSQGG